MPFTLNDIFEQATLDKHSVSLNAPPFEGRLLDGIKIIHCYRVKTKTHEITILNTQKGGDRYQEVSTMEYEVFMLYGWSHGVCILSLSNCCLKIDKLTNSLEFEETQLPRRDRILGNLENQLNKSKSKHNKLINKLNQFKSINYDKSQK
jgi:hypothetical protein